MNHQFPHIPIPPGKSFSTEACYVCNQIRRRTKKGTYYYELPDGTFSGKRPEPCGRELRRRAAGREVDRMVDFFEPVK